MINNAIVISSSNGNFKIQDLNDKSLVFDAKLKGNIRNKFKIVSGDYIEYIQEGGTYLITNLKERKNSIIRPKLANIDNLIIVQSCIEPNINISQLFKYHTFYKQYNIQNIIFLLTKTDLMKEQEKNTLISNLKNIYKLNVFNANDDKDIKSFLDLISKGINCFVGQSGVGKSTFLNKIFPNLNLRTNEISKHLNRGKHTTTVSTLYNYKNGYVVDTPGFSSIEITCSENDLAKIFFNFDNFYNLCKFNDCKHLNENNCYIRNVAIKEGKITNEIYNEYLKILNNLKKNF